MLLHNNAIIITIYYHAYDKLYQNSRKNHTSCGFLNYTWSALPILTKIL